MSFGTPDLAAVLPEVFLLSLICIILLVDVFVTERYRFFAYEMAQATLMGTAILILSLYTAGSRVVLGGHFVTDNLSSILKVFMLLVSFIAFLYARDYLRERQLFRGEYFILSLFAVLGMMVMVSAHSFLVIYLGLELLSLSLYALVALHRDSASAVEAAMKYFVLGALASGMLLYGMSMLYGATGSLDIARVGVAIAQHGSQDIVLVLGLVFVIVGLAFKLGAVPFHMWIPDVYHGAPTSVTLFIGTVPKLAAFAVVIRLLAESLGGLHGEWRDMLIILVVLSMGMGNVLAIAQSNLKRMLAYSTISHVGFLLLGVLAGTPGGYAASMFYTIVYALMALGGFGMILLLSRAGFEADRLEDFKGLSERSPWFAFIMLVLMFSLAGVPPTLGFFAKLYVLQEVVRAGLVWLAVVGVVFSIVGAFYYLRVVKLIYFDKPEDMTEIKSSLDMRIAMSANGLAMLALGVYPGSLMALCASAFGH